MTRPGGQTRWRRRVLVLSALSIVLGIVTTWAVAWTYEWLTPFSPEGMLTARYHSPDRGQVVVRFSSQWARETLWVLTDAHGSSNAAESCDWDASWSETWRRLESGDPVLPSGRATGAQPPEIIWEIASGWPFLCLKQRWCVYRPPTGQTREVVDGAFDATRVLPFLPLPGNSLLPYTPIRPGLVANTLFFASGWMLLLLVPWVARRAYRRGHGRCLCCGYDLRGDTDAGCPECGRGRTGVETSGRALHH
jgi:hypothetical protein